MKRRNKRYFCFFESSLGRSRRISCTLFPLIDGFDGELLYYPEILPVAFDFRRVLIETVADPAKLFQLSPRHFEELIARTWERFGYSTELTSQTRDGGRDIIAIKESEANFRLLIECKRYQLQKRVDVGIVRSLYGVKVHEHATKAILATTSRLTKGANDFVADHCWELEARDYDGVVCWLKNALQTQSL